MQSIHGSQMRLFVRTMRVRVVLEERYGFDFGTWLLLSAAMAAPLALWVPPVHTLTQLGRPKRGECPRA